MGEQDPLVKQPTGDLMGGDARALDGIDQLVRDTVSELNRVLETKQVVGEPMTFGNTTIIPLVSVGFGFGAGGGGGGGNSANGESGQGGGHRSA